MKNKIKKQSPLSAILIGITRELDKKSLLSCYPIYISYTWSMLQIITPALMSIYHL